MTETDIQSSSLDAMTDALVNRVTLISAINEWSDGAQLKHLIKNPDDIEIIINPSDDLLEVFRLTQL